MSKKKKTAEELEEKAETAQKEELPPAEEAKQPGTAVEPTIKEQLAASQEEAKSNYDLFLRGRADLENYRKRAQREKEDLGRFANEKILREILPIKDNLERAVDHARENDSDATALLEGVEMTLGMLGKTLEQFNVKAIPAIGEPFDPARHEAMGQVESDEHPANTVIQEFQKGYFLNDRLLRPAMVMVSKKPAAPEAESE